jgi:cytochrome o ubiquinol oxidase subunit 3
MSQTAEASTGSLDANRDYTATGIPNKKLFTWAFLAMESVLFGALLTTHLICRVSFVPPTNYQDFFDIPFTSFSTFVLLGSTLLMGFSLEAISEGRLKKTRLMLLGTILAGLLFVACQIYETNTLVRIHGLTLRSHIFGSTFYLLLGTHALHVMAGIFWLLGWLVYSFTGKMTPNHIPDVGAAGHYWRFICIVWFVIFPAAFLTEYIS